MVGPSTEGSDAARARASALIGRTLSDRYRIVGLAAMGAMGAIYRAEHLLMRKSVAVKVLHPEIEGFPELMARFEREAVAGAHVHHPNVATASDFGKFDGESAFLVLEFIEGITLRALIERGPVPAKRAAAIVRQAAAGLAAVHEKGIVHRDIKPKNIMIVEGDAGRDDVVKLIDFGLAKVPIDELSALAKDAEAARELTQAGVVLGTLGYLAPEAALGTRSILAPADQYALGVVFYEMLCGKAPFEGVDAAHVFYAHRKSALPWLRERNPDVDVPDAIEAIVRRMLEKEPDARFPSATALVSAIDAALGSAPPAATSSPVPMEVATSLISSNVPAAPARTSRAAIWIGAFVVVATIAAAFALLVTKQREATRAAAAAAAASAAAASASAEPPPRPPPPRAAGALERLRAAAEGDPAAAIGVLVDVADTDPGAFADRAVQTEAAGIVETAASKGVATDAAFDRLSGKLGSDGLDVLYDLVAREQRSSNALAQPASAGSKARAILARSDAIGRATPAMRVAYDLRNATCQRRPSLFARAGKEGDDRALEILRTMQAPACNRRDPCCLHKNRQLELAIADIQARLRH